jgi:F-type H+-transporting ATPase subunit delta
MIAGSLARRYARAILDVGVDRGNIDKLTAEIRELAASFAGSRDLAEALTNPVFPRTQRRAVLEAVLDRAQVSLETRNFTLMLLERERMVALPDIARELGAMVDDKMGRAHAEITSARPLTGEQLGQIERALEKVSGKKIILARREDASLLGGVVAQLGDVVYDGSVRTQLEQMREQILHS